SFILFVLMITAYAVLFTWVYNTTKGSLFLMVLFHAALTTTGVMFLVPQRNVIIFILYVILLWVAVTLVVVMAGAARLSRAVAPALDCDRRFEKIRLSISSVERCTKRLNHQSPERGWASFFCEEATPPG